MLFMKKYKIFLISFYFLTILIGLSSPFIQNSFSLPQNKVQVIQLNDDTINPVTADYIIKAIDAAAVEDIQCLVIKLDTPGGLLSSTRLIVKKMLMSPVPVVVYIAPSGSRAGSAGVFITYASHVAAMAPSTNIGAAHPVKMGGGELPKPNRSGDWKELKDLTEEIRDRLMEMKGEEKGEEKVVKQAGVKEGEGEKTNEGTNIEDLEMDASPMESKILQDTVAFIRTIAKERNRNEEWGVKSVTKSLSITNKEAFETGVVEIIAQDEMDLLLQLDGRKVMVHGQERILKTKGAFIEHVDMDAREKFFNILANPNIAYFLMILGFYGLLFEVTHPGFGVPGIMGTIFLILAFYSMQTLPTNYAGLALLILGLILFIAEAYAPGIGLLALGGLVSLILGSMLLFESVDPIMRVSMSAIIAFSGTTAVITIFLIRLVIRSQRSKVHGGKEGLMGEIGEAEMDFEAGVKGKVFVHGELWNATSSEVIKKGEEVCVEEVKGLTLGVRKKKQEE